MTSSLFLPRPCTTSSRLRLTKKTTSAITRFLPIIRLLLLAMRAQNHATPFRAWALQAGNPFELPLLHALTVFGPWRRTGIRTASRAQSAPPCLRHASHPTALSHIIFQGGKFVGVWAVREVC